MDGKTTLTSTVGCEHVSVEDVDISMKSSSLSDEITHTSSQQDSTTHFPLSVPTSIGNNNFFACDIPKDQISVNEGEKNSQSPMNQTSKNKLDNYSSRILPNKCQEKRVMFRHQKNRHMTVRSFPPALENSRNSYFTKYNRPIIEEKRRKERELELEKKITEERQQNWHIFISNIFEFILASIVLIWQIFYSLNVIPNDNILLSFVNYTFCGSFCVMYMVTMPIWWAVVSCSLILYFIFAWLFGASCSLSAFGFAAIFAKSLMTVIDGILLLV